MGVRDDPRLADSGRSRIIARFRANLSDYNHWPLDSICRSKSRIALLVFFAVLSECIQMQGSPAGNLPVNETERAIGIALNDSVVMASLTERWTIKKVNLDAASPVLRDGKYVTFRTPNVMIETQSGIVNMYVDLDTRSVVNIDESLKR